ncbi:MAG TPA: glutamyl-tRNA reductase [Proteobacteria bacterium]|nr:glutamyl-tRNA reductase [Pseudomonadota bacterium]
MPDGASNLSIVLIGLNHETAPVEIRERLTFGGDRELPFTLIRGILFVREFIFLSTCNRVEVLMTTPDPANAEMEIKKVFTESNGIPLGDFERCLYIYHEEEAAKHLFRVAASLDSMVLGEPQILGQIKDAYRQATDQKTSGVILNRLLHKTFSVAKRVRTETGICSHAVSISFAAVELARKIFADLKGKRAMLIGAGEMAELASEHLISNGVAEIVVANRTLERAIDLAQKFKGRAVSLDEVYDQLSKVDIIISSTGAPGLVINYDNVKSVMRARKNRPLFLIDIAVPRDIDPRTNEIDNVYLYDIDDLKGIVELNKAERQKEALRAERIVEEEVIKFKHWLQALDITPIIVCLREKAEQIRLKECRKTLSNMGSLTPEQEKAVHVLTASIVNKMLHDPITYLKGKSSREHKDIYLDFARQIFNLNGESGDIEEE